MVKTSSLVCKTFVIGIIILLLSISVTPSIGITNSDDTIPPETTHTLDPPEPDGNNGWYVSDVNVTLTATDDISGVNVTYYKINDGEWIVYTQSFTLSEEGDNIFISYYSIDNAGNIEIVKHAWVNIDQIRPEIAFGFEYLGNDVFLFRVIAEDRESGMEHVEIFIQDEIKEVIYGSGPYYYWETTIILKLLFLGFICQRNITKENIQFYAILVIMGDNIWVDYDPIGAIAYDNAGNSNIDETDGYPEPSKLVSFRWFKFENNYSGHIGRFFINAWIVTHWDNPYSTLIDSDRFMKDL